jgi:RHS repeat-associated protein
MFSDGFESGNFSAWTSAVTDSGSLSVTGGAALVGSYGMSANINDNNAIYVNDYKPFEEATYRARFYFDPNSITMTNGDRHYILVAGDRNSSAVVRVEFYRYSSVYQVRAEAVSDGGSWSSGGWRTITDEPHYLELSWWAASAAGANDGGLTFWIDGTQQDTFTSIDNDTRRVEYVQLGPSSGIDTGTRSTLYFDAFESRRTTYIGPVAGLLSGWKVASLPGWEPVRAWVRSLTGGETASVVPAHEAPESDPPALLAAVRNLIGRVPGLAAPVQAPRDVGHAVTSSRTISYTYDNLYRLTGASYNDGATFTYTYDATGNRLTEVVNGVSTAYVYDNANRLTSVGGVSFTWDDNGNLLYDGVTTYTYNHANQLASRAQGGVTTTYTYNGQGDRVRQRIGGTPTTYALDLAAGLTQVLSDGSSAYLYGVSRIGEEQSGGWMYHMVDALGSVRQLVDGSGVVALERAYRPFGDVLSTLGTGTSIYAFAGEQRDASGLVYLRARYYAPGQGRFLSRDVWEGDPRSPMSYNLWIYGYGNPVLYKDPWGTRVCEDPWGDCIDKPLDPSVFIPQPDFLGSRPGDNVGSITDMVFGEGGNGSFQAAANITQTLHNRAFSAWYWNRRGVNPYRLTWSMIPQPAFEKLVVFIAGERGSGRGGTIPAYNAWRNIPDLGTEGSLYWNIWEKIREGVRHWLANGAGTSTYNAPILVDDSPPDPAVRNPDVLYYHSLSKEANGLFKYAEYDYCGGGRHQYYFNATDWPLFLKWLGEHPEYR